MPYKNTIKQYVDNGYYHIYNRGVDKREIFLDEHDCIVFLYYLKIYLSSPESLRKEFSTPRMLYKIVNLNLYNEVDLLSFALMPNHFHLQIKQSTKDGIQKLTKRVLTAYVQYFNKKYKRIGTLFETTYKAILTKTDEQHLYLSAYIHRNPMILINPRFDFLQFSSYFYYLNEKTADWIKTDEILNFFRSAKDLKSGDIFSYQSFVGKPPQEPELMLKELTLENKNL